MLFLTLFTFLGTAQIVPSPTEVLKLGESRRTSLPSCYLASDEKADDKGLPRKICFNEVSITLHPQDAFAQPELVIETSDGKKKTYTLRKEKDISGPKDVWPNWIEVSAVLLPTAISDTGEDRLYQRSLSFNFWMERNGGNLNINSLQIRGTARQMVDQYHPAGEEEIILYDIQD